MLLLLLRDRQKSTEKHVFARLETADMRAWSGRGRRAPARGSGGGGWAAAVAAAAALPAAAHQPAAVAPTCRAP